MLVTTELKVPAVLWGRKNEKNALFLYGQTMGITCQTVDSVITMPSTTCVSEIVQKCHANDQIKKCGLFIHKHMPFLGASPDSIIECECCGKGVVEVKCPYKYREASLPDIVGLPDCCMDENFSLKVNHKWYEQIQFQMGVCNVQYGDFVYWTPRDAVIYRVLRDDVLITAMFTKCSQLWFDHLLPELVTRGIENAGQGRVSDISDAVYCICRKGSYGQMVGCDRCDEWYHIECLKLKRMPRAKKWYCAKCR